MSREIINELANIDEVELIYINKLQKENNTIVTYNIVCDMNSVVENINVCKRIIAIMEVIKSLVINHNVTLNYNIKTSDALEEDIMNNNRIAKKINLENVLYDRNNYFKGLLQTKQNKKTK